MPKRRGLQDPIGTYLEWAKHRYDPGHYLGGTIEPHLRKSSLGPRARRLSGLMLFFSGLAGLSLAAAFPYMDSPALSGVYPYVIFAMMAGVSLLTLAAGVGMFRPAVLKKSDRKPRRH
jgi:hypothetical protein